MAKGDSQRIRDLLLASHIEPARRRGERRVRVVSGDVARQLGLRNRFAQVCTAMESQRFLRQHGLEIVKREGPPSGQSSTVAVTYRFSGDGTAVEDLFEALRGSMPGAVEALRRERAAFERDFKRRQRLLHP